MVFLFCKFIYIMLLCFVYGWGISTFLYKRLLRIAVPVISFPVIALTGLMCINVIAGYLSLWLPMGALANMIILAGCLLIGALQRKYIGNIIIQYRHQLAATSLPIKIFFGIAALYMLYISSLPSFTYDEGLYYSQFIKWTQQYRVVPGLANLHTRFGFNSEWHVLSALFNGAFLTGQAANQVNGLLYLLVLLYLLGSLRKSTTTVNKLLKMGLLLMIHMPQLGVYYLVAPAADLVVFYLLCMLICTWLEALEEGCLLHHNIFLWMAPAYLVTVKLSAVPVLFVTAMLCVQSLQRRQYRPLPGILGISLLTVAPWLIRNVILSGYLLFPFEKVDLFTFDWKVPLHTVKQTREVIEAYGYLRDKIPATQAPTRWLRLQFLFRNNTRAYDLLIIAGAFLSPVIVWWKRKFLPAQFITLYIFLWLGVVFWFIQAPDPRFGYGYLATLFVLTLSLPFVTIPVLKTARVAPLLLCAVLVLQEGTLLLHTHLQRTFIATNVVREAAPRPVWLMPAPYTTQSICQHKAPFNYYTPIQRDLCWDAPLPCADHIPSNIRMRSSDLQDGFAPIVIQTSTGTSHPD